MLARILPAACLAAVFAAGPARADLNQPGQAGLGAQAGPGRLSAVIRDGGFRDVRVAVDLTGRDRMVIARR